MTGMPTRILLKKHRFKFYYHSKMVVAETSFIKKNHHIPRIINQNIAQKLIEKTSMTDIVHQLLNFSGSIISVVGKTTVEIIELFEYTQKKP